MITKNRSSITASLAWYAICFLPGALFWPHVAASQDQASRSTIDWKKVASTSRTTLTLQVVVNPPLRQGSPIHDHAWSSLRDLHADYVRFVPWLPYPHLAVAELEPPTADHVSWDFSLLDPLVSDFFNATADHPVMLNFSTIPQWMFRTDKPAHIPSNPDEVTWDYEQGQELRDPSAMEVADYYARLAARYSAGGFTDELGKFHSSLFHHKIALWEVLNEPDFEHSMSPQTYTKIYDAVVESVQKILPDTQFVGMSLAAPSDNPAFFEYFLNPANHRSGIPLDFISYHFYAIPGADENPAAQQFTFFDQADKFLTAVRFIQAIRQRLSPNTKTAVNEAGCIVPNDSTHPEPGAPLATIPDSYWNLCGAMFAYLYVGLARQGVDIVASSQLLGYPTQYPSVSLLDWKTGQPNARYWVLKLLREHFAPGDQLVDTPDFSPSVFAQAFLAPDGTRKLLLVNQRDHPVELQIPGAKGAHEAHVDTKTAASPAASSSLTSDAIPLGAFSVCVLTLPHLP